MSAPKQKKCPKCKLEIAADSYDWHLENGHNDYFEDPEKYDYDDLDPNEIDFLQPNMDATKDYGYPCREDGRYGSLSGHDGYDDESES